MSITTVRLAAQEAVIARGLATFVEVGRALQIIRDEKLYPHRDFEGYVQDRWGMTPGRARQLIDAQEINTMVSVSSERTARELVPVLRAHGADAVVAVMSAVKVAGPVTAATIRRESQRMLHPIRIVEPVARTEYTAMMEALQAVIDLAPDWETIVAHATTAQYVAMQKRARRAKKLVDKLTNNLIELTA